MSVLAVIVVFLLIMIVLASAILVAIPTKKRNRDNFVSDDDMESLIRFITSLFDFNAVSTQPFTRLCTMKSAGNSYSYAADRAPGVQDYSLSHMDTGPPMF